MQTLINMCFRLFEKVHLLLFELISNYCMLHCTSHWSGTSLPSASFIANHNVENHKFCSKPTRQTSKRQHYCRSGFFIADLEQVSQIICSVFIEDFEHILV